MFKRKIIILFVVMGLLVGLVLLFRLLFVREVDLVGEQVSELIQEEEVKEEEEVYVSPFFGKEEFPVKAIYSTFYTASIGRFDALIDLINRTELNAIVVDIKDYSGKVGFDTENALAEKIGAEAIYIKDLNGLVRKLHSNNIYAIARITVFQDPILAEEVPALAIKTSQGKVWKDNKGLAWLDPAAKKVWDYNIDLAKEAAKLGFDEINFDYVRFPSDGDLETAVYPFWDEETLKSEIMRQFFEYLYNALAPLGIKTSVDIFGQTFYNTDDLGIGQLMEIVVPYFDYVSPMVYPSHYIKGFLGFQNPVSKPYEVVKTTLEVGQARLSILRQAIIDSSATNAPEYVSKIRRIKPKGEMAKIRPWLQDFDLGMEYGSAEVAAQIRASEETGSFGWMFWNASNVYTEAAFK
jgi:hypothetical protein